MLGLVFHNSTTYMLQKATSNSESLYLLCLYTDHENIYCVYVDSHRGTLIKLWYYMFGNFLFQCYQSITHSNRTKGLLFKWKNQTKFHPMLQVNSAFRNSEKVFSGFYTMAIKSKRNQTSKDVSVPSFHEYTPNSKLFIWALNFKSLYCHWGHFGLLRTWPILKFSYL